MRGMVLDLKQLVIGVDRHKWEQVAVAVDGVGRRRREVALPATPAGYEALPGWAREMGSVAAFGIEGTGSMAMGSRASCAATARC